jgi:hypothetical protein
MESLTGDMVRLISLLEQALREKYVEVSNN